MNHLPKVKETLVLQELGNELLVFDPSTDKGHCLGQVGLIVLKACAASSTRVDAIESLRASGAAQPEAALDEALNQLEEEGLFVSTGAKSSRFDRRKFLAAAGAMASLPVVTSVLAPRPAQALSCQNCTVVGTFPGTPTCAECGHPCPSGAACNASSVCCFEYTIPAGAVDDGVCHASELSGAFFCRQPSGNIHYSRDCAAARTQAIASSGGGANQYYCCNCPASAPQTCP